MKTTDSEHCKFESKLFALDDFRQGEDDESLLSSEEQAEVLEHLESCEHCRQRRADQQRLTSLLDGSGKTGEPTERLVSVRSESLSQLHGQLSNDKLKFWRTVASLAVAVAVLMSCYAMMSAQNRVQLRPEQSVRASTESADHFGVSRSGPVVTNASWMTSTVIRNDPQRTEHFVVLGQRQPDPSNFQTQEDENKNTEGSKTENEQVKTAPEPLFVVIRNDFGKEAEWTIEFLEQAHAQLVAMMDNPDVEPPRGIEVVLEKQEIDGLGGYASPTQIGFQAAVWPREQFRLWITVHELTNLFACHYAGAGGFPSDWWSNGRSPFPQYTAGLVCEKLGEKQAAQWLKTKNLEHTDQQLYWHLHEKYGFELFAKFLKLIREDGLDLGFVGEREYPVDDECRSAYTIAYLSIAAGENLAPIFREFGIGTKPRDWDDRHEEDKFIEYSISNDEVERVIASRKSVLNKLAKFRLGKDWSPDEK